MASHSHHSARRAQKPTLAGRAAPCIVLDESYAWAVHQANAGAASTLPLFHRLAHVATHGFATGLAPKSTGVDSTSGSYILLEPEGSRPLAILKPEDEEPYAINNQKGYVLKEALESKGIDGEEISNLVLPEEDEEGRDNEDNSSAGGSSDDGMTDAGGTIAFGKERPRLGMMARLQSKNSSNNGNKSTNAATAADNPRMRHGIAPGEGVYREVAAYLLDHGGFSGVPPTALALVRHNSLKVNPQFRELYARAVVSALLTDTGLVNIPALSGILSTPGSSSGGDSLQSNPFLSSSLPPLTPLLSSLTPLLSALPASLSLGASANTTGENNHTARRPMSPLQLLGVTQSTLSQPPPMIGSQTQRSRAGSASSNDGDEGLLLSPPRPPCVITTPHTSSNSNSNNMSSIGNGVAQGGSTVRVGLAPFREGAMPPTYRKESMDTVGSADSNEGTGVSLHSQSFGNRPGLPPTFPHANNAALSSHRSDVSPLGGLSQSHPSYVTTPTLTHHDSPTYSNDRAAALAAVHAVGVAEAHAAARMWPPVKRASLQLFIPHTCSAADYGPRTWPVNAVHRLAILDIRLANTDRNLDNILVRAWLKSDNREAAAAEAIAIEEAEERRKHEEAEAVIATMNESPSESPPIASLIDDHESSEDDEDNCEAISSAVDLRHIQHGGADDLRTVLRKVEGLTIGNGDEKRRSRGVETNTTGVTATTNISVPSSDTHPKRPFQPTPQIVRLWDAALKHCAPDISCCTTPSKGCSHAPQLLSAALSMSHPTRSPTSDTMCSLGLTPSFETLSSSSPLGNTSTFQLNAPVSMNIVPSVSPLPATIEPVASTTASSTLLESSSSTSSVSAASALARFGFGSGSSSSGGYVPPSQRLASIAPPSTAEIAPDLPLDGGSIPSSSLSTTPTLLTSPASPITPFTSSANTPAFAVRELSLRVDSNTGNERGIVSATSSPRITSLSSINTPLFPSNPTISTPMEHGNSPSVSTPRTPTALSLLQGGTTSLSNTGGASGAFRRIPSALSTVNAGTPTRGSMPSSPAVTPLVSNHISTVDIDNNDLFNSKQVVTTPKLVTVAFSPMLTSMNSVIRPTQMNNGPISVLLPGMQPPVGAQRIDTASPIQIPSITTTVPPVNTASHPVPSFASVVSASGTTATGSPFNVWSSGGTKEGKRVTGEDIRNAARVELVPIDHGLCLPSVHSLDDLQLEWVWWPQTKEPFSASELAYIASLNAKDDALLLRTVLGAYIRPACLLTLRLTTALLQEGAKLGLTLHEIARMMLRGDDMGRLETGHGAQNSSTTNQTNTTNGNKNEVDGVDGTTSLSTNPINRDAARKRRKRQKQRQRARLRSTTSETDALDAHATHAAGGRHGGTNKNAKKAGGNDDDEDGGDDWGPSTLELVVKKARTAVKKTRRRRAAAAAARQQAAASTSQNPSTLNSPAHGPMLHMNDESLDNERRNNELHNDHTSKGRAAAALALASEKASWNRPTKMGQLKEKLRMREWEEARRRAVASGHPPLSPLLVPMNGPHSRSNASPGHSQLLAGSSDETPSYTGTVSAGASSPLTSRVHGRSASADDGEHDIDEHETQVAIPTIEGDSISPTGISNSSVPSSSTSRAIGSAGAASISASATPTWRTVRPLSWAAITGGTASSLVAGMTPGKSNAPITTNHMAPLLSLGPAGSPLLQAMNGPTGRGMLGGSMHMDGMDGDNSGHDHENGETVNGEPWLAYHDAVEAAFRTAIRPHIQSALKMRGGGAGGFR